MTLVGDVAQTGSPAAPPSWGAALSPYVGERFTQADLTVNYRTPAQVMDLAVRVARAGGVAVDAPTSVRTTDEPPQVQRLPDTDALGDLVRVLRSELDEGRLAVITPAGARDDVVEALTKALDEDLVATGAGGIDAEIAVLTARESKGLEFDAVVVLDPAAILAEGPRGANDLYVAMTRPTRRLVIATADAEGPLPPGF